MGVRTSLIAVAPIAASITQAELLGIDVNGILAVMELKCQEITTLANMLKTDVFTPASDSTAGTAMSTQITALS